MSPSPIPRASGARFRNAFGFTGRTAGRSSRFLAGVLVLAIYVQPATAVPPSNHNQELGVPGVITGLHANGYHDPLGQGCTLCHGDELKGAFAPSCFECHGAFWDPAQPQFPDSHTLRITGNSHTPRQADCTFCHDMYGDEDKLEYWHAPGHGTPLTSGCTQCHGPNLDGVDGIAFSCRWCHDRLWAGQGPPSDHTVTLGGFAKHKPGYADPINNRCTQCHGPNLDDGFAPSCYGCHGPGGVGPPADHTDVRGGFARHQADWSRPETDCTRCHGPHMNDGYATSCLQCHRTGGVTPGHHMGDRTIPYFNCAPCHSDPLTLQLTGADFGSTRLPSCVACHAELWIPAGNTAPSGLSVAEAVSEDSGPTVYATAGEAVTLTAVVANNPDGDPLTYQWWFGDDDEFSSPSDDPATSHVYRLYTDQVDPVFTATLAVTDGVHAPVLYSFQVVVSPGASTDDTWSITTTEPDSFLATFQNQAGALVVTTSDGGLGLGIEMVGVIYWMDVWVNASPAPTWGIGTIYFGNINRDGGTMSGIVIDAQGAMYTFEGTKL